MHGPKRGVGVWRARSKSPPRLPWHAWAIRLGASTNRSNQESPHPASCSFGYGALIIGLGPGDPAHRFWPAAVETGIKAQLTRIEGNKDSKLGTKSSRDATPEARAVSSTTDGFSLMLLCLDRFELRRLDYREVL